ncbi:MAG: FAD-dependent oxidoreductase, partial [Pseudomonadales bacterium]
MSDQAGDRPSEMGKVLEPLIAADTDSVDWDETSDIVVVGFGGAGATAAMQAREEGATVRMLERFEGGGATMLSGGIIYSGGGTRQQEA